MSYPSAWREEPPEVPPAGTPVKAGYMQYAADLRKLAQSGELGPPFDVWLFEYEQKHPGGNGGSTYAKMSERNTSSERTFELNQVRAADGAQVAYAEGQRLDRVVAELARGIEQLRIGFSTVVGSLNAGMGQLQQGYAELRLGNEQLQADQRSFLGLLFPQMSMMMEQNTEAMTAYRKAVIAEAKAETATKAAQLGNDGATGEAEKAIVGMLTEVAKTKMLEVMSPKPAPAPAAPPTPEAK